MDGDSTADGSTWEKAMTLQSALDSIFMPGDQLWIAAGTYKPDSADSIATFTIPAGVRVYGGFEGTETAISERTGAATILSGDLLGDDTVRTAANYDSTRDDNSNIVVTVTGANVILDGLTITAGNGESGAGLSSTGANTAVTNCTFTNNTASNIGGGAYFTAAGTTLTRVTFTDNMATNSGGGAYFLQTATLTSCTFTGNTVSSTGGGAHFLQTATLTSCTFTGNTGRFGGGAYFRKTATLTNGVFAGNTATANGGGLRFFSGGTVINTTLYNNTATGQGGGMAVAFNDIDDASGVQTFPFNLQNSLMLGNGAMDGTAGHQFYVGNGEANAVNIQHNLLAGGDTGIVYATPNAVGIIDTATVDTSDAAVVFASTTAGDTNYLRLKEGSPAINVGNNDYLSPAITTDLAGAVRIQGGTVDLGAYESDTKLEQMITFTLADTGTVNADPRPHGNGKFWTKSELCQLK